MQRIIVLGCPGAGKSTFATKLQALTHLPLYHLDCLFHNADRTTVDRDTFDARLGAVLAQPRWIIDGNYMRTIPMRLQRCDTVFLFDLPLGDCLRGAQQRIGRRRADLPWVEDSFDPQFRQYIIDFPTDQLPAIYRLLQQLPAGVSCTIFHSHREADEWLAAYDPE